VDSDCGDLSFIRGINQSPKLVRYTKYSEFSLSLKLYAFISEGFDSVELAKSMLKLILG